MKTVLAIAALATFGSFAAASANAEERSAESWGVRSATDASARVQMAFSVRRAAQQPSIQQMSPEPVSVEAPAVRPAAVERVRPSTPWYGLDRSLQRGDIVVTETGALVYEGEKGGKRHFRTVAMSRLVSAADREKIVESVRR